MNKTTRSLSPAETQYALIMQAFHEREDLSLEAALLLWHGCDVPRQMALEFDYDILRAVKIRQAPVTPHTPVRRLSVL